MAEIPYTFETFVVGDGNNLCVAVCKGVSGLPGQTYNPLFIYGEEGVGKTHLLRAVGNALLRKKPDAKIVCMEVEQLAVRLGSLSDEEVVETSLREFADLDLLLLDDLQRLEEDQEAQRKFAKAFNVAFSNEVQLVITCDRKLEEFPVVFEQILSRGLQTDIQKPDYESRVAILRKRAEAWGLLLTGEATEHLAKLPSEKVSDAVAILGEFAEMGKTGPITLEDVKGFSEEEEEEPEERSHEYVSFLKDVQGEVSAVVDEGEEEQLLREEYEKTLYFWEMKGYDTSCLRSVMGEDLETVRKKFSVFRNGVERLIELEAMLGSLNTKGYEADVKEIESLLYNPDSIAQVEELLDALKRKIKAGVAPQASERGSDGFSFQTFVVGECNQMAYAAAKLVARSPAKKYNPLFIWGGVGMGKTHLLHAIRREMLESDPVASVMYVSAERFTNELIRALEDNALDRFRDKYRRADALMIDDVQFLAGKDTTQQEFFHCFNALYSANRQIVITSDRSPNKLSTLEERLRSRFQGGLVVQIQPPDFKTRASLIKKLAREVGLAVGEDVVHALAEHVTSNMRELCGAVNKIAAFASLSKKGLQPDTAVKVLNDEVGLDSAQDIVEEGIGPAPPRSRPRRSLQGGKRLPCRSTVGTRI